MTQSLLNLFPPASARPSSVVSAPPTQDADSTDGPDSFAQMLRDQQADGAPTTPVAGDNSQDQSRVDNGASDQQATKASDKPGGKPADKTKSKPTTKVEGKTKNKAAASDAETSGQPEQVKPQARSTNSQEQPIEPAHESKPEAKSDAKPD